MKAFRAVVLGPPPEDYVLSATTSSWRRRRSSAVEEGDLFRLATTKPLTYSIEETEAQLCCVAWLNERSSETGEESVLLPCASVNHFSDAKIALLEKFGDSHIVILSISSLRLGACQLRKARKNIR